MTPTGTPLLTPPPTPTHYSGCWETSWEKRRGADVFAMNLEPAHPDRIGLQIGVYLDLSFRERSLEDAEGLARTTRLS